jgi:hypothetical protein
MGGSFSRYVHHETAAKLVAPADVWAQISETGCGDVRFKASGIVIRFIIIIPSLLDNVNNCFLKQQTFSKMSNYKSAVNVLFRRGHILKKW